MMSNNNEDVTWYVEHYSLYKNFGDQVSKIIDDVLRIDQNFAKTN